MDSVGSWQKTMSTTKVQYPKAYQFTTIMLAKQLYLTNLGARGLSHERKNVRELSRQVIHEDFALKEASS
ncbi:MAG: hypothetical protein Q8930_20095 [Bacillota bacterium]|nr:hypothetical protein [Bacillota bacterium]